MKNAASCSGIVLAAGRSSRFGSCKGISLIEGLPAVVRCINLLTRGGASFIVTVTGAWQQEVQSAVPAGLCSFTHNANFEDGMFSSILTGIQSLPPETEGVLILPVDIPMVAPQTVEKLIEGWRVNKETWLVPVCMKEGRKHEGHPVLIPAAYRNDLKKWSGHGGLEGFLRTREQEKMTVRVFDEGTLMDMDAPEDLESLRTYARRIGAPSQETIESLWSAARTPPAVIFHQRKVAEVALAIAERCGKKVRLDIDLLKAAALLHDILKGQPQHAERGALFIEENGFSAVAELVRGHMDLPEETSREAEVLYLADKYVDGTAIVPLQVREKSILKTHGRNCAALASAMKRMKTAYEVEARLKQVAEEMWIDGVSG